MRMQTIFEAMGGTYQQEGDHLFPNIEVPESPAIGIWGQRRLQYLRTSKRALYAVMLMGDKLKNHLEEVDQSAERMFNQLIVQMKVREGITEELKANNQLEWVQRMNNIRNRAAESVYKELIYV
jgi:hypothetical protein